MYMLLLTSRRKTGLSSGKIKITFWIALKAMFIVMKKRDPCTFWIPAASWLVLKKSKIANKAVMQVVRSFT